MRVVVPLRTGKVTAKSAVGDLYFPSVSAAELSERIRKELVGRDGIEPPTPGFSVDPEGSDHASPSSDIVDNQSDSKQ
jgi:hypothetical protein